MAPSADQLPKCQVCEAASPDEGTRDDVAQVTEADLGTFGERIERIDRDGVRHAVDIAGLVGEYAVDAPRRCSYFGHRHEHGLLISKNSGEGRPRCAVPTGHGGDGDRSRKLHAVQADPCRAERRSAIASRSSRRDGSVLDDGKPGTAIRKAFGRPDPEGVESQGQTIRITTDGTTRVFGIHGVVAT